MNRTYTFNRTKVLKLAAGTNMVFDQTQTYFSPSIARGKMRSKKDQKHVDALEHQLYYYYTNFRG